MPFTRGTFLGASVRGFRSGIGWNMGAPSELTIDLVEDPENEDLFTPVATGQPVLFEYYSFRFCGLLQKVSTKRAIDGLPTYEVTVVDPREILDGAQIILSGYNGSVGSVKNLLNVYGYWESFAFGTAESNESGMPWNKIRQGIVNLVDTPVYGLYGGPLTYRGVAYSLNFNEMPIMPNDYRVGGTSIGLLELIAQVCEDAGFDFFIDLNGYTITVRTVSRKNEPPLGTISALVSGSYNGTVLRSEAGIEGRNETTSSFLIGGNVTQLEVTDNLVPYWGLDIFGNPIVGVDGILNIYGRSQNNQPPPLLDQVPTEFMTLNAAPVADILGSVGYPTTTYELRFAQGGMKSWASYLAAVRPDVANLIGLFNPVAVAQLALVENPKQMINDNVDNVKRAINRETYDRQLRMYEFVKGYADEYLGKKFLIGLPFILSHLEEETLRTITSYEITDSAYLPDGSVLGLSTLNQDIFMTQDNRFRAFVRFDNLTNVDFSRISPKGTALEGNSLYMECAVDSRIVYTPNPAAIVTLSGPLLALPDDIMGGLDAIAKVLKLNVAEGQKVLDIGRGAHSTLGIKLGPVNRIPSVAAIPLRSNILTYGPWSVAGAPGKVKVEQDTSLVPWNYGGYTQMNIVGNAKVASAVTNMQVCEAGVLEVAGPPVASMGDVLQAGGPNVTNISVSVNTNGVVTSYRFQTYTPRFGVITKGLNDRMKRLALANASVRKAVVDGTRHEILAAGAIDTASRAHKEMLENAHKAVNKQSPHEFIMGHCALDKAVHTDGMVNVGASFCQAEEALSLTNANNDAEFKSTAGMTINGFFRPFSTAGSGVLMPGYTFSTMAGDLNQSTLDPWKDQNDIDFYIYGDSYNGFNALVNKGQNANARPMGLRSPLVLCGWGYDIAGKPVPSEYDRIGASGSQYVEASGTLYSSQLWKVGPYDAVWDFNRGVWTSHDAYKGTTVYPLPAGGSGLVTLKGGDNDLTWDVPVWNWFSTVVPAGKKVIVNFVATDNKLYVVAADC